MSVTLKELAAKVASLENDVRDLRKEAGLPPKLDGWKAMAGCFKDDPMFEEVVRYTEKLREDDRARTFAEMDSEEAAASKAAFPKGRCGYGADN